MIGATLEDRTRSSPYLSPNKPSALPVYTPLNVSDGALEKKVASSNRIIKITTAAGAFLIPYSLYSQVVFNATSGTVQSYVIGGGATDGTNVYLVSTDGTINKMTTSFDNLGTQLTGVSGYSGFNMSLKDSLKVTFSTGSGLQNVDLSNGIPVSTPGATTTTGAISHVDTISSTGKTGRLFYDRATGNIGFTDGTTNTSLFSASSIGLSNVTQLDFAQTNAGIFGQNSMLIGDGSGTMKQVTFGGSVLGSGSVSIIDSGYGVGFGTVLVNGQATYFANFSTDGSLLSSAQFGGIDNLTFAPVPEPSTYALMGLGLTIMGLATYKRSKKVFRDAINGIQTFAQNPLTSLKQYASKLPKLLPGSYNSKSI